MNTRIQDFMDGFVDSRKIWSGLSLVDQATSRQVFGSICYNYIPVIYIYIYCRLFRPRVVSRLLDGKKLKHSQKFCSKLRLKCKEINQASLIYNYKLSCFDKEDWFFYLHVKGGILIAVLKLSLSVTFLDGYIIH